jgi:H+/Cl- antiporter ClcA
MIRSNKHFSTAAHLLIQALLSIPVAIVTGSAVALFLWLLEKATQLRWANPWLLFSLPVAGLLIVLMYRAIDRSAEAGNDLVIDEIHEPGGGVPGRMAPLVLIGTIITHLFGGSAGREGTAVQMGGSIAGVFARITKLKRSDITIILMAGVAAGFGAVFGTPLAGALFAMEVLAIGNIRYTAVLPCLVAAITADLTCSAWGIHHTQYHIGTVPLSPASYFNIDIFLLVKIFAAATAFGLTAFLFAESVHGIKAAAKKYIPYPLLVPVIGGILIIALVYLLGTRDYLGLGVTASNDHSVSILSSFHTGGAEPWSWLWKLVFTAITLGSGFKGGEVTPLFFIGATFGNTLAWLVGAPVDLFAGLGFIAVFAGATNTPLACTIMGAELFGSQHIVYFAIACFTAYFFSGHSGIYSSQRISVPKPIDSKHGKEGSIRNARSSRIEAVSRKLMWLKSKLKGKKK